MLIPAPSLTSCLTRPGGPSLSRFPLGVTLAALPASHRCCEDPKTELRPKGFVHLTAGGRVPQDRRNSRDAPAPRVQDLPPDPCPCPEESLLLPVTVPSFALSILGTQDRNPVLSLYSPALGTAPGTTQITVGLNLPGSLMSLSWDPVLSTLSPRPQATYTCASPRGPPPGHRPSPGQGPDFILFHPFPLPLPTELAPPVSLSFRATRSKGLIC